MSVRKHRYTSSIKQPESLVNLYTSSLVNWWSVSKSCGKYVNWQWGSCHCVNAMMDIPNIIMQHDVHVAIIRNVEPNPLTVRSYLITTSEGSSDCINHHDVTGWPKRCLLGFQWSRLRRMHQERDLFIRVTEKYSRPTWWDSSNVATCD
jgi:hypothetical protein